MSVKNKMPGVFIFQLGLIMVIVSAIADYVGLGGPYIFFGPKQWVGVAIGLVVAIFGLRFALNKE